MQLCNIFKSTILAIYYTVTVQALDLDDDYNCTTSQCHDVAANISRLVTVFSEAFRTKLTMAFNRSSYLQFVAICENTVQTH